MGLKEDIRMKSVATGIPFQNPRIGILEPGITKNNT
jgi:hypothetical protein